MDEPRGARVALPRDLLGMREALRGLAAIRKSCGGPQDGGPAGAGRAGAAAGSAPCEDVLSLLERAIGDEPPATLSTPGVIRDGFSAGVDDLVAKSRGRRTGSPTCR